MSNFIERAIEFIKGDTPKQIAERIQKRGTTAMRGQLAAIENDILAAKDTVENAEEEYKKSLYNNGIKDFNSDTYLKEVFSASRKVDGKKKELKDLEDKKSLIEKILEDLK